ncbi:MAG: glycosyltransferase family 4 protein [Rikenellaceae bacterium]|nr:glycosyltransferase family 4 protein [Rikenellaceae bacterium]
MNVLFLTMSSGMRNVQVSGIYTDLVRKFRNSGHSVYIIAPYERRTKRKTELIEENGVHFLGVRTLNLTKTNVIEKGIGQVMMEYQFTSALKKYWGSVNFDLILYSTPPITFTKVIQYAKRNNPRAVTYLLLKDIFPQNAVDMSMLSKRGIKGLMYKSFRSKEKMLYNISDHIGCMSPANVRYVIEHNPYIDASKVEIAPNSYDLPIAKKEFDGAEVRAKYNLPTDKPIFIYGGNMGKPQGIPFLIRCLDSVARREDCHFLIVGNGTEYPKLQKWYDETCPTAVTLFKTLPKEEYDKLASSCDVGLIFLDYNFTIPNYPSRLLPYLMERKPIIAATDPNCDTGVIAEENGYGYWCPSNDVDGFVQAVDKMLKSNLKEMGENGFRFFENNYTTEHTYNAIIKHCKL